jgi:hypothetical protein
VIDEVVAPLLHNNVPVAFVLNTDVPQLFTTVTTGVDGMAVGAAVADPAKLVHPLTVEVTLNVPAGTVIEEVVAPLLHNNVPVAFVLKTDVPQLSETVTTGVAGIAFTVIVTDALVPQASSKDITALPADKPVTTPLLSTMATVGFEDVQLILLVTVERFVVFPSQIIVVPDIGATIVGRTFTVKVADVSLLLASVAVTVTVFKPTGNTDPEGALYVIVTGSPESSVAVAVKLYTAPQPVTAEACKVVLAGTDVKTGGIKSGPLITSISCICVTTCPF